MRRRWVVLGCASISATTLTACDKLFDLTPIPETPSDASRLDGIADIGAPGDAIAPCFLPRVLAPGITNGLDPQMRDDRLEVIYAKGPAGAYDLYHAKRSIPTSLFVETVLLNVNTVGNEESDPALTLDGLLLIFKSNRGGTGQRIWQATRLSRDDDFTSATQVQGIESVSPSGIDISPDGNTIYIDDGGALLVARRASRDLPFDTLARTSIHFDYPTVTPNGLELFSNDGGVARFTRAVASDTEPFVGTDVIDTGYDADVLPNNAAIIINTSDGFYTRDRCN